MVVLNGGGGVLPLPPAELQLGGGRLAESHQPDLPPGDVFARGAQKRGPPFAENLEKTLRLLTSFLRNRGKHCFLRDFGAFCLDVRTLTSCQLMGFPLSR